MIITASYKVALAISHPLMLTTDHGWSQSPLNPAVALAMITFSFFKNGLSDTHFAWIYLVLSWAGSVLAWLCFEFVFKKAQSEVLHDEEIMDAEKEDDHAEITQPLTE
jgi:glycerol uptake facilitator-like aquaporin